MSALRRRSGAFTLIELLVVISIITLLVALLLPILGRAREIARLTMDMANTRSNVQGFQFYVNQRGGRFPSRAYWDTKVPVTGAQGSTPATPWNINASPSGWHPAWQSIINWEYYHGNNPNYYPCSTVTINVGQSASLNDEPTCGPIIRWWDFWNWTHFRPDYLKNRYATCPNLRAWMGTGTSNLYTHPYVANMNAVGAYTDDPNDPGKYGTISPTPKAVSYLYGAYLLGARPKIFANPTNKFLIFESEYNSDAFTVNTTSGTVVMNDNPGVTPPWTAQSGEMAFRHMLPNSTSQNDLQAQARAAVGYVDGHAGSISPNDKVASASCFEPGS